MFKWVYFVCDQFFGVVGVELFIIDIEYMCDVVFIDEVVGVVIFVCVGFDYVVEVVVGVVNFCLVGVVLVCYLVVCFVGVVEFIMLEI